MTTPKTLQELIAAEKASLVRDEDAQAKTWDKLEMSIAAGVLLPLDVLPLDVPDLPLDGSGLGDALANGGQVAAGGASATGAAAGAAGGAAAGAAGGAASTTGAAAAATTGSSLLAGAASKVVVGLLVAGGGVGSWYVASTPKVPEAPVAQTVPSAPPVESKAPQAPALEVDPPEAVEQAAAEAPEAAPSPEPNSPKAHHRMAKDTFDGELQQIRRAQGALAAGQNERALRIVEEHEKQAPRGQFSEDREALRTLALCRAGDAKASRVAKGFLRRFPNSVYVEGVKAACLKGAESNAPRKQR